MTSSQLDDLEAVRKVVDAITDFDAAEQERILRWAREKVGLAESPVQRLPVAQAPAEATVTPAHPTPGGASDIKSFAEAKNPATDTQFAATVAYYYRFEAPEHLRKESINADDLQEACRLVGRTRPTKPAQTLINALAQGFLDRRDHGTYAINTVGENLVAMALPTDAGHAIAKKSVKKPAPKPPKTPTKTAKKTPAKKS